MAINKFQRSMSTFDLSGKVTHIGRIKTLLYVLSSIAIILMGKRELVALLNLSSWWLMMIEWLFLAVPWGCLQFVIVVFPDHTHYFLQFSQEPLGQFD